LSFDFLLIYKNYITILIYYALWIIEKSLIFILFELFFICYLWIYLVIIFRINLIPCFYLIILAICIKSPNLFLLFSHCPWILICIDRIKFLKFFSTPILLRRYAFIAGKYSLLPIRDHLQLIILKFHCIRWNITITFNHLSKNPCNITNMLKSNTTYILR
jgi:hypothetical protein